MAGRPESLLDNIMILSDSYKARQRTSSWLAARAASLVPTTPPLSTRAACPSQTSHWRQYPPGTTEVYSYFESRGGKFSEITFFGLQYIIKRYLTGQVHRPLARARRHVASLRVSLRLVARVRQQVVTKEKIDAAEKIVDAHMGLGEMKHFNREGCVLLCAAPAWATADQMLRCSDAHCRRLL